MVTSTAASSGLHFKIHYRRATHLWQRQFRCRHVVKVSNQRRALGVGYLFCCHGHSSMTPTSHPTKHVLLVWICVLCLSAQRRSCSSVICPLAVLVLWCLPFFDALFSMRCTTCRIHPSGPPSFDRLQVCMARPPAPSELVGTHVCCLSARQDSTSR